MVEKSLRRPAARSVTLLVLGIVALGARQTVIVRGFLWSDYRLNEVLRARNMARFKAEGKPWPFPPLVKPAPLHLRDVLGYATYTGLTILLVGVLALTLVAAGRRWLWLPVALGGLCLGQATIVVVSYSDWASWVGVALSLAVVVLAAVPLLLAGRGVSVAHRVILPRSLGVTVVAAVLAADYVWVQHFNGPVQPRPAASLALVYGLALLTASPLRRRWLPLLMVGAVLAVPQLQEPLGGLVVSGPTVARESLSQYQVGPLLFTVALGLAGLAVGQFGARGLALWHTSTMRGPELHLRHKVPA